MSVASSFEATNLRIDEEIESLTKERDKNKKILDELMSQPVRSLLPSHSQFI